jgi:hypothetical protein
MPVVALSPLVSSPAIVRCECAHCGAHVKVRDSWQLSGQCQNCGGYELRPLEPATRAPLPPAPVLAVVPLDPEPVVDVPFPFTKVA